MSLSVSWNKSSSFFGCLAMRVLLRCGINPPCRRKQRQGGFIIRQYIRAERSSAGLREGRKSLREGRKTTRVFVRSSRRDKRALCPLANIPRADAHEVGHDLLSNGHPDECLACRTRGTRMRMCVLG